MADTAVLEQRLEEAEDALHKLSTGTKEVSVGEAGSSVSYNQVSIANLKRYIAGLKVQLGQPVSGGFRPLY